MIKNERQYRITRAQVIRFSEALRRLNADAADQSEVHPRLLTVQKEALQSQLSELEADIQEYETLKTGDFAFEKLKGISELPKHMIRARIASGLSQRELADRLGLKEQQIQRYEASDYASASLTRIRAVVSALGVEVDEAFLEDEGNISLEDVLGRVSAIGLEPEFIRKRLFPRGGWHSNPAQEVRVGGSIMVQKAAETLARVFRWSPQKIFGGGKLELESALEGVRFKTAARVNARRVTAYTVYVRYLTFLSIQACSDRPVRPIPTDPTRLRDAIESKYGSVSLVAIVNYLWDLGVVVLPLDDPGVFHGACFRKDGRSVIVLKQKTSSCSRWAFDCLHECWHAGQEPELPERTVLDLDEMSSEGAGKEEETTASRFAGAVLLNGRGQELAKKCLAEAQNDLRRLKAAVKRVAEREAVSVDSLANYLAFRLSVEQGKNWWGTANSLQSMGSPWRDVRNIFFERADFTKLAKPDREILVRALVSWEE